MKTKLYLIIALGLTGYANAQECDAYYPMDEGNAWTLTNYNAKGKEQSKDASKIVSKGATEKGEEVQVETTSYDKKGEQTLTRTYTMKCEDGVFYVDMSNFMAGEGMNGDMQVTGEADFIEIPADAQPGQQLKDGTVTASMQSGGVTIMKITVEITNRKVESKESKEVSGKSYECVVMTYDINTQIGPIPKRMKAKQWYSKGVGLVRSETYNKGGKLMGYSELTEFK